MKQNRFENDGPFKTDPRDFSDYDLPGPTEAARRVEGERVYYVGTS